MKDSLEVFLQLPTLSKWHPFRSWFADFWEHTLTLHWKTCIFMAKSNSSCFSITAFLFLTWLPCACVSLKSKKWFINPSRMLKFTNGYLKFKPSSFDAFKLCVKDGFNLSRRCAFPSFPCFVLRVLRATAPQTRGKLKRAQGLTKIKVGTSSSEDRKLTWNKLRLLPTKGFCDRILSHFSWFQTKSFIQHSSSEGSSTHGISSFETVDQSDG